MACNCSPIGPSTSGDKAGAGPGASSYGPATRPHHDHRIEGVGTPASSPTAITASRGVGTLEPDREREARSGPREMWLVLHERETDGYLIAFDPSSRMWGLVMGKPEDQFVLVSGLTETFINTVIGM